MKIGELAKTTGMQVETLRFYEREGLLPEAARTEGNYVEYAYRLTERGTTRTVSGLWWDDAQAPVAGYLLAYWKDGVGESWAPMRDLWSRYA